MKFNISKALGKSKPADFFFSLFFFATFLDLELATLLISNVKVASYRLFL